MADAPGIKFSGRYFAGREDGALQHECAGRSVRVPCDPAGWRAGNRANPVVQTGEVIYNARFSPPTGDVDRLQPGSGNLRAAFSGSRDCEGRSQAADLTRFGVRTGRKLFTSTLSRAHRIFSIEVGGSNENLSFGSPVPLFALPPSINLVTGSNPDGGDAGWLAYPISSSAGANGGLERDSH